MRGPISAAWARLTICGLPTALAGVMLMAAVLPYLLLARYNVPSIHDDFQNAVFLREYGRAGYIAKLYHTWTGRYTEMVLKAFLAPLSYRQTDALAQWQPVLVILLLLGGTYLFLSVLVKETPRRLVAGASVLIFVLYVGELPNAGSVLYWFGGYTAYTAGIIASFALFAGLIGIRRYRSQGPQQIRYWLLAAGGAIAAVGAYEVCLVAVCWLTFTVTVYTLLRRQPERWWYSPLLAVVIGAVYFSASAPGNAARAATAGSHVPGAPPLMLESTFKSLYLAFEQVTTRLNSVILLAGTLLLTPWLAQHSIISFARAKVQPLWLAFWLVSGLGMLVLPAVSIYSNVHQNVWQCAYFYLLIGWQLVVAATYQNLVLRHPGLGVLASVPVQLTCQIALVFLCFGSSTSNTRRGYLDLAFRAAGFASRARQRVQSIQQHRRHPSSGPFRLQHLYSADEPYKAPVVLYSTDFTHADRRYFGEYYRVDCVPVEQ